MDADSEGLAHPPGASPGRQGFSLVELVYVMAVVGILAAIALPRIDVRRPRVDAATLEVGSHLLLAQRVAVLRQHDVRILFDAGALVVHEDQDNDRVQDAGEPVTTKELGEGVVFGFAGSPALLGGGAAVTFTEGPEGLPALTYHRNGSGSEEGAIHVSSTGLHDSDDDRAVRLERATGLTRCWSRRSGSWEEGC